MILRLFFLLLCGIQAQKVLINNADYKALESLPLSNQQLISLHDFIVFQGPVNQFYDLKNIKNFTAKTLNDLKPLISLEIENDNKTNSKLFDRYQKVENWTSEEGANEGLVEVWLDRLAEPKNINKATWNDLMALQNVSPVDAVAVMKRIKEGPITYPKALRGAIGLSYWGYRNMSDFFIYKDVKKKNNFHFWYNATYKTLPSTTSLDEDAGIQTPQMNHPGDLHHKMVSRYGEHWKLSLATHRQLGETVFNNEFANIKIPNGKWSLTYRDLDIGGIKFERIIAGNFSATMGQGVVFENTDFFSPRRSGYSWSRRVHGVFPDISRTREYALKGLAFQARKGNIETMGFISRSNRDAILNNDPDSSFSSLITLYPRTDNGFSGDSLILPMLNTVQEVTYGGNARFILSPGTILGFSIYESLYDRPLKPDIATTVIADANEGKFLTSIGNTADTEIASMYGSTAESSFWNKARSFRRVYGVEFSTVIKNLAIQGEYGILDKGNYDFSKKSPKAFVLSGYLQFNNLTFLTVFRDYDLGFDNPYQRSFANYQRYKGTIFEDTFYLEDPIYGFLYTGQAQPQAERGIYVNSRFQVSRSLVLSGDYDTWTRVADLARYYRTVAKIQFRPLFNVRFNLRHKWQKRAGYNSLDPSAFYAQETILRSQIRLSSYDQIELILIRSWVDFTSRRRLTVDLQSGGESSSMVGSAGTGSEGIGFKVTHNFNKNFKIMSQTLLYNGFIWNFEDTDFRVFDSSSDAIRFWVSIFSRLNNHWAIRLKYTVDSSNPITNYTFESNDPSDNQRSLKSSVFSENSTMDIRLQLDYVF
mgnify:CR=1 FL=1